MKPTPATNQTPNSETVPTRRALDPFFETGEHRDHANQWDVTVVWPEPPADPKKAKPAVDPQ